MKIQFKQLTMRTGIVGVLCGSLLAVNSTPFAQASPAEETHVTPKGQILKGPQSLRTQCGQMPEETHIMSKGQTVKGK